MLNQPGIYINNGVLCGLACSCSVIFLKRKWYGSVKVCHSPYHPMETFQVDQETINTYAEHTRGETSVLKTHGASIHCPQDISYTYALCISDA